MLGFQRRISPRVIAWLNEVATVAHCNRNTRTTQADVWVKNSQNHCLRAKPSIGTFFSELSLCDLDKKWPRRSSERENEKKHMNRQPKKRYNNYSAHGVRLRNENKACFWVLNFTLKSQQMVPNCSLHPYKCPEFHPWKILLQFWANKHSYATGLNI